MSWDVRGTPRLLVRHGRAQDDSATKPDTIALTLVVKKGRDSVMPLEDILEFPSRFRHTVTAEAAREGNDFVGRDTANPASWPSWFVIHTIRAPSGRPLTVGHGERRATLSANGSPSAALQGVPLAGAWELRSPAGIGEEPDILRLDVTVNCVQ